VLRRGDRALIFGAFLAPDSVIRKSERGQPRTTQRRGPGAVVIETYPQVW
jgi:hypothetical protein